MDTQTWRNLGLLLHILGIVLLSGGTVGGDFANRFVWRNLESAPTQAAAVGRFESIFGISAQIGSLIMLASGLALLQADSWVYWGQIWLDIKLALFVLLTLNGILFAAPAGKQLDALLPQWIAATSPSPAFAGGGGVAVAARPANKSEVAAQLAVVRGRLNYFHASETLMFIAVLVLAVFKFN